MKHVVLIACLFIINVQGHAAQVDDPGQLPSSHIELIDTTLNLWSASGDVADGWDALDPISILWGELAVGDSGTSVPSAGMTLTLDKVEVQGWYSTLRVASTQGANNTGTGTTLVINDLAYAGNIEIEDSLKTDGTGWQNRLIVHSLTPNTGRTITRIGKDSLLEITRDGGTTINGPVMYTFDASIIELAGGALAVKDGLTLENAGIHGSGTVLDSVILNSRNEYQGFIPSATIHVNGGERQDYGKDVSTGTLGGVIAVHGSATDDGVMTIAGTLRVDGTNSVVEIDGDGGRGILRAGDIALSNNARIDVLGNGRLELGTGENNALTIIEHGSINAAGGTAAFLNAFDMRDDGRIDLSDGGVLDIRSVAGGVELSGGILTAGNGTSAIATGSGALALAARGVLHVAGDMAVTAGDGAPGGTLVGKTAESIVVSNNGSIRTGELRADFASSGTGALFGDTVSNGAVVTPSGSVIAETFFVTDQTDVRGHDNVRLTATNAVIDGVYRPGANDSVTNQASIHGTLAGSLTAGAVILDGGTLDGSGGGIQLRSTSAAAAVLGVTGDSVVRGAVDASRSAGGGGFALAVDGNLTMADAASLAVESYSQTAGTVAGDGLWVKGTSSQATVAGASSVFIGGGAFDGGLAFSNAATLKGNGNALTAGTAGRTLHVDATSRIDLSDGGISLSGFDAITLEGALIAGAAHNLALADGTRLDMAATARIEAGQSLVAATHAAGDFSRNGAPHEDDWVVRGEVSAASAFTGGSYAASNIFGDYIFRAATGISASAGGGIWLDSYRAADIANVAAVQEKLNRMWGTDKISLSFAAAVSGIARNMAAIAATGASSHVGAYALPDSAAGETNYAILAAMAAGNQQFSHSSIAGQLDAGLLSAYTGHMASGPTLAAMETGNVIMQNINGKLATDREVVRLAENAIGSDRAVASQAMKERLANRAWAGVLGVWQNADMRQGQAGYRYSGVGVLTGYDRVFGDTTVGGTFGFVSGAYQDKSARAHDSSIDSYSFDAYASCAAPENWHMTFAFGYSLGDNDLKEFRGGNWDGAKYMTRTWHAGVRAGYDWRVGEALSVSPALGLNYFHTTADAHTWRYGGTGLLRYGAMTADSLQMPLDVSAKYRREFGPGTSLTFSGGVGYIYTFNDDTPAGRIDINGLAGVRPVQAIGRRSGHGAYSFSSGLVLAHNNIDIGLRYDLYAKPDFSSHQLTGSFGLSF